MKIKITLDPATELRLRYISAELDRPYSSLIESATAAQAEAYFIKTSKPDPAANRPPEVTPC
jgi:hypothetical protein